MLQQEWTIQSRGHHCAATGKSFTEGEHFYTLLFDDKTGYRREDLSEMAFRERPADSPQPFSFWRTKYTPPPPPDAEPIGKQTAEDLLRSYMADEALEPGEDAKKKASARYLLAVMLERKRILKEIETKRLEDGALTRIYEHSRTGEVFVIPDPELRLDQLEQVQVEVGALLG